MGKIFWKFCIILKKLWEVLKIFSVFGQTIKEYKISKNGNLGKFLRNFGKFRRNGKKKKKIG